MTTRDELLDNLREMRKDMTSAQIRLTEAIRSIAALPEDSFANTDATCTTCSVKTRGPLALAEHLYTSHDGPLPDHYARADKLAGIEAP